MKYFLDYNNNPYNDLKLYDRERFVSIKQKLLIYNLYSGDSYWFPITYWIQQFNYMTLRRVD